MKKLNLLRFRLVLVCLLALFSSSCSTAAEDEFLLGGIQVNEPELDVWLDQLQAAGMNTVEVTDYAKQGDWDTDHMWWDDNEGILNEMRAAKARGMKVVLILRVALDHAFERNRFLWHGMIMPTTDEQLRSWFEQYTRFVRQWAEIAEREKVDVLMIASELNALTSTLPAEELPNLEAYYLDEKQQIERKAKTLGHETQIEERHLWQPGREQYPDLASYLDARIAKERDWAAKQAAGAEREDGDEAATVEQINQRRSALEGHWRKLIAEARKVYKGKIGYAANFDQYHLVGFWDALDLIGINAYFKIRDELIAERSEERLWPLLEAGWSAVLAGIDAFRADQGLSSKPVIFTEIGYTYRANSTLRPWSDTGFDLIATPDGEEQLVVWRDQPDDPGERALAMRALYEAHRALPEPFLEGLLYWKLSTLPGHRDIESFVLILGEDEEDPLLAELQRFKD